MAEDKAEDKNGWDEPKGEWIEHETLVDARDGLTAPTKQDPDNPIVVAPMCQRHRRELLKDWLQLGPDDGWVVADIQASVLLLQGASSDDRIWSRAAGKTEGLSLVLAEIGCLACWDPALFVRVAGVMKKGTGHAALVSQGKLADEGFDLRKKDEKGGGS